MTGFVERREAAGHALQAAAIVMLIALATIPYLPSLDGGFLSWDDNIYITENAVVKHLRWSYIWRTLSRPYYTDYSPAFVLSLALEYRLTGGKPAAFHLASILGHALCTLLVFFWIGRLCESTLVAALGGALFAAHPVQVESVAWVTEQKNVFSTAWMLLSLVAYTHPRAEDLRDGGRRWYIASLVFAALAMFTKPSTVILPMLVVGHDVCFRRMTARRAAIRAAAFFMLGLIVAALAVRAQYLAGAVGSWSGGSFGRHFLSVIPIPLQYAWLVALPYDLCALRPGAVRQDGDAIVWLGAAFLVAYIFALTVCWRRSPVVFYWLLWAPITLLPVSNIIPVKNMMAERYLYLPLIGAGALAGMGAQAAFRLWRLQQRRIGLAMIGLIILTWAGFSWSRSAVWIDSLTLWRGVVRSSPSVLTGRMNLVFTHIERGNVEGGVAAFERAGLFAGDNTARWLQARGDLLLRLGQTALAVQSLEEAVSREPQMARSWFYLGQAYALGGRADLAEDGLRKAVQSRVHLEEAHANLATLLMRRGQFDEAERHYLQAIRHGFLPYKAWYNLATLYLRTNRPSDALHCYGQVLALAPPEFERLAEAQRQHLELAERLRR